MEKEFSPMLKGKMTNLEKESFENSYTNVVNYRNELKRTLEMIDNNWIDPEVGF